MSQPLLKETVFVALMVLAEIPLSDVNKSFMFSLDLCKFLNIVLSEF